MYFLSIAFLIYFSLLFFWYHIGNELELMFAFPIKEAHM